jgi:hypothetical protein
MICASAARIASIIASDHEMLRQMSDFLDAVTGDADLGAILTALPEAVAACSPFEDEQAMTEAVRRETLRMLNAIALRKMPAMGTA